MYVYIYNSSEVVVSVENRVPTLEGIKTDDDEQTTYFFWLSSSNKTARLVILNVGKILFTYDIWMRLSLIGWKWVGNIH